VANLGVIEAQFNWTTRWSSCRDGFEDSCIFEVKAKAKAMGLRGEGQGQ